MSMHNTIQGFNTSKFQNFSTEIYKGDVSAGDYIRDLKLDDDASVNRRNSKVNRSMLQPKYVFPKT